MANIIFMVTKSVALTQYEKEKEAIARLRYVIDNKELKGRQQRVYEILKSFNIELSYNMKRILTENGLKY